MSQSPPPHLPISFFNQVVVFPMTLLPVPCPRIENSNLWYEHVCLKNAAFICILSPSYPSINQTLLSASTGCTRIYAATSAGCSIMHKFMPAARDGHRLFEQTKVLRTNKIFREKRVIKEKKLTNACNLQLKDVQEFMKAACRVLLKYCKIVF